MKELETPFTKAKKALEKFLESNLEKIIFKQCRNNKNIEAELKIKLSRILLNEGDQMTLKEQLLIKVS